MPDQPTPPVPFDPGAPLDLRTLGMTDPLGLGDPRPPFGWRLPESVPAQTGYRLQVAGSPDALAEGRADLWDSGEVDGDDQHARFAGDPLDSRAAGWWRVQVRGADGTWSAWSAAARFELGLLRPGDWAGNWISHPDWYADDADPRVGEGLPLPLLAGEITLAAEPVRARLHVAGAGVYYASINGAPVSDAVLEPAYTDFPRRVAAAGHDVTGLLRPGANVIGIELGPGIAHVYPHQDRYMKFYGSKLSPRAIAELEVHYADGTTARFGTDGSWRAAAGATLRSHWFGGEDYDARRELPGWNEPGTDRSGWAPVVIIPGEGPAPVARTCPPLRVVDRFPARTKIIASDGTPVFDVGVVQAGLVELAVDLPAGTHLRLVPGDQLDDFGRVVQSKPTTGSPIFNTVITGDGPLRWHPRFRYDGFRYVEVQGLPEPVGPEAVTALVVRADNEPVGAFETSVPLINSIHTIIDRAVQGNMYSVLTDCPHREKLGWLEQVHLLFDVVAYNYDVAAYYRELLATIAEAQTEDGLVPDIAPEYVVFADGFRDDPNWGGVIISVPWQLYRWYGDLAVLEDHYPAMVRYLDYLTGRSEDGLLPYGLGDWIGLDKTTPVPLVGTWGYWRAANAMINIATALGRTEDAERYRELAAKIVAAFRSEFHDPGTGRYGGGGQAAELFALDVGAVPTADRDLVLDRISASVDEAGITVGEIALPVLFRVLGDAGRHDVLWRFANRTEHPGYGYQVEHGATALTEAWDGPTRGLSQNHFMLGAIDSWFYRHLAGIGQAAGSLGWRELDLAPVVVDGLDAVTARTRGARGDVAVAWRRDGGTFRLDVTVPAGSVATVRLPAWPEAKAVVPETAEPVTPGADGRPVWRVPAGAWSFELG
ncbi:family 78 glycoside hydrolase catalytic domain [Microlunatus sp. GCM10028923]|uniref:family 78 glycoside hydrolase catalytic domain n=1 Tax=Microlunatus sp. GCM10028923 TaxID=3273400 RepID=UPI00361C790E